MSDVEKGIVLSWTVVHRAPGATAVPFVLVLLKTPQGNRFALADAEPDAVGVTLALAYDEAAGAHRARPLLAD